MEDIKIVKIRKNESKENINERDSYLEIELNAEPSEEWKLAYQSNVKKLPNRKFSTVPCTKNLIKATYPKTTDNEGVLKQIETLVKQTNEGQGNFDAWIDKTNARLDGGSGAGNG